MKLKINISPLLLGIVAAVLLSSCRSSRPLSEAEMARIRAEVDAEYAAKTQQETLAQQKEAQRVQRANEKNKERILRNKLVKEAQSWVGVRYKLGGNDHYGIDCSGLVVQIYQKVYGKKLHRTCQQQYSMDIAEYVSGKQLKPGNLVFFCTNRRRKSVNHVGIYLDDSLFVHAGNHGVVIEDLRQGYWVRNWISGGKVK